MPDGLLVVTGAAGTGKSSLAAHLLAISDPQRLGITSIDGRTLGSGELIRAALRRLAGIHTPAGPHLLIVDHADHLAPAEIDRLPGLANLAPGHALRVLLLARREPSGLRSLVAASHRLEALEHWEVRDYVEHRLRRAGWNGEPALTHDLYAALARASGGVPRRINLLAERLLRRAGAERRRVLDAALLREIVDEQDSSTQQWMPRDTKLACFAPDSGIGMRRRAA